MATFPSLDQPSRVVHWARALAPIFADLVGPEHCVTLLCAEKEAADDTLKLSVLDASGRPRLAVLVSAEIAPQLVDRAMERAAAARRVLGPVLGRPILEPLRTGVIEGRSYAVLPYLTPMRERGPVGRLQAYGLANPLLDWLQRASARTLADVGRRGRAEGFERPLLHVLEREDLPDRLRAAAERSLLRLQDGSWSPRHVLMHGDLWRGNVLLRSRGALRRPEMRLIDWPGSRVRGYGIYDLVRLAQSFRLPRRILHRELRQHAILLGCELEDTRGHLLAALGWLGLDLEHFPVRQYLGMTAACFASIEDLTPVVFTPLLAEPGTPAPSEVGTVPPRAEAP